MSKKKVYEFEIIGESEEEVVNMDVEISNGLVDVLVEYANSNITKKEKEQLLLNWAFVDILKSNVNKNKRKNI